MIVALKLQIPELNHPQHFWTGEETGWDKKASLFFMCGEPVVRILMWERSLSVSKYRD